MSRPSRALVALLCALFALPAPAEIFVLQNQMRVEGIAGKIASVRKDPAKAGKSGGEVANKLILFADDGMRRTYFSFYQRQTITPSPPNDLVVFRVPQRVMERGRMIGSLGSLIRTSGFDDHGRRTVTMNTGKGPLEVVMGMTEISPTYVKTEGLQVKNGYNCEMRIATSSVPREILSKVIMRQIDRENARDRWRIVRFYIQARRYQDALVELENAINDFPDVERFKEPVQVIYQRLANELLDEIKLRRAAGQHYRVYQWLQNFPTKGVASELLGEVREILQEYDGLLKQRDTIVASLDRHLEQVKDAENKAQIAKVLEVVKRELTKSINTLNRFADYERLQNDDEMTAEQKLALAISGWYLGSGEANLNLATVMSLPRVHELVRLYMVSKLDHERQQILEELNTLEGSTPSYLARIIRSMTPPVPTESQTMKVPGMMTFKVAGIPSAPQFEYTVQLPLNYDPYRKYPCVVTLHGARTSPEQQIDWWAGPYSAQKGMRLGQATRRGFVVIAPHWTKPFQGKYGYSAREHAAVLNSLRDAIKRFAIDTDNVFLSGHSMGGDAAWDIGLAHPDYWAGVIPVSATGDKYITRYWENARHVPLYFVQGERDNNRMDLNGREFDRYFKRPKFDCMVVEYQGRGHEHFHDEVQRLFDWIAVHTRNFANRNFSATSMRRWDNYYWWVEVDGFPEKLVTDPLAWPKKNAGDAKTTGVIRTNNVIRVTSPAKNVTLWLSPELVNFDQPVTVQINRSRKVHNLEGSRETLLEDVRLRGDRQHPFWVKVVPK